MKAYEISRWFLLRNNVEVLDNNANLLTNLKIQKLLYYAQGIYLAFMDEKLFDDDIVALEKGPVVTTVYNSYKQSGIKINDEINFIYQDEDKIISNKIDNMKYAYNVLETVFQTYIQFSGEELSEMTHHERPWKETPQGDVININLIKEYFETEVLVD